MTIMDQKDCNLRSVTPSGPALNQLDFDPDEVWESAILRGIENGVAQWRQRQADSSPTMPKQAPTRKTPQPNLHLLFRALETSAKPGMIPIPDRLKPRPPRDNHHVGRWS